MGQHKAEKDFRNKLNRREITPSENAWDRLDAMLTLAEEEKPKRSYGWMYIAASIVGFLLIGTVFLSQTEEMVDVRRNDVVIQNKPEALPSQNPTDTPAINYSKTDSPAVAVATTNHQILKPHTPAVTQIHQKTDQNPDIIAATENQNQSIINQKTEQQITPAKVDELLTVAQIPQNETPSIKVNAKNLLSEVEGEVNISFREKMLRKVGKNYHEVAEAVSNRNNQ